MKVEQLDLKDREEFGRIVNILLAENCIYQYAKIRQFEKKERNADYVFIHDHWDCFEEYLRYAGWLLCRERSSYMGMIYLVSGGSAIGGGDVKLMAVCGLLLGWELIIFAFLLGCIIGSVIHLIRMKVSGEGHVLAMGPYLSAGVAVAVLWGNEFLQWYLGLYH